MAKKKPKGGRTTPKGTRPPERRQSRLDDGTPPIVRDAEDACRSRDPLALMLMASAICETLSARPLDRLRGGDEEHVDVDELVASFVTSGFPAMVTLARAMTVIHPDRAAASRVAALVPAVIAGPRWQSTMDEIEIVSVHVQTDPLGDGHNVNVSFRWPGGIEATAVVYVDHNMGTIVKDAFVVPVGAEELIEMTARVGDLTMSTVPLDPADARARIEGAITLSERMWPPVESESWPMCRPFVEWIIGHLPEGGTPYDWPEVSESERAAVLDAFVAEHGESVDGLSPDDVRLLASSLVDFASTHATCDPLRWSAVSVEIVLDWYARTVLGIEDELMRRVPDVLERLIEYAHGARSVPPLLTGDALGAVLEWTPDYLAALDAPRSPTAGADRIAEMLVEAGGLGRTDDIDVDVDGWDDDLIDDLVDDLVDDPNAALQDAVAAGDMARVVDLLEQRVTELVGGREAYEKLDTTPLPDVPMPWEGIDGVAVAPVTETLELLDRWSAEFFDVEVRTIARQVLAAVLRNDRSVFNRSPRPDALAAGILSFLMEHLAGRMNADERRALGWSVATKKELAERTGISPSTMAARTNTITGVMTRSGFDFSPFLHSGQRAEALASKRSIEAWRAEHP